MDKNKLIMLIFGNNNCHFGCRFGNVKYAQL